MTIGCVRFRGHTVWDPEINFNGRGGHYLLSVSHHLLDAIFFLLRISGLLLRVLLLLA